MSHSLPDSAVPGMPSSIPVQAAADRGIRVVLAVVLLVLAMLAAATARADTIVVKSAELRAEEDGYYLNAEFDFSINSTLDEALQKGVPLYFCSNSSSAGRAGTGSTKRSFR